MATVHDTDEHHEYTPRPAGRSWIWAVVAALIAIGLIYWIASLTAYTPDRAGNRTYTQNAVTGTDSGKTAPTPPPPGR